ncbi:NAD(P)/FAD-dependent oxidoreductase [Dactylosporangium sp. CA-092794]|uniref:NAD(P)/FAD-dependent oxidoreductase n=1 Tax=Dactylosporangium sp. CA-092794 TaxID=3239929 RepID=UPI003D8AEC01
MTGVVVVGAGLAGLRAAESLRQRGYEGALTIVGDEAHGPYNRPPLSKDLLRGAVPDDSCRFDTAGLDATWLLGRSAVRLDVAGRHVTLDDGRRLGYERLLVATGCRARPWPAPVPPVGVHMVRTLDDARKLRAAARESRRAVIVGGGFIGCEIAATLRALGLDVVLLDTAEQLMTPLGAELGERARAWHEDAGVAIHLGIEVEQFLGADRVSGVRLVDGRVFDADLVVIGIGAVPNTEWLADSGLELVSGGVRCDERCLAVGAPEIGVIGDVAARPDPWTGTPRRVEHWTNAVDTAITAAANLLAGQGGGTVHRSIPTFWSDQYHYKLKAVGWLAATDAVTVVADEPDQGRFVAEFHRDGQLVAAATVNDHRAHLGYRRRLAHVAIRPDQLPLSA